MDNFKEEIEVYEFTDRTGKTERFELIDADRFGGMNYYAFVPYDEDDDNCGSGESYSGGRNYGDDSSNENYSDNYYHSNFNDKNYGDADDALFVMKFQNGDFFPVSGNEYYSVCEMFLKKFDNMIFY
jgi:hypothetical protein